MNKQDVGGDVKSGREQRRLETGAAHQLEDLEMTLLLQAIYVHWGFDFRDYARASLRRRLWKRASAEGVKTISALQDRVLHDPEALQRLLLDLSINVTSMFRDPTFYMAFRQKVVPILRTYPWVRIWDAGCSSGEETYSLAILLEEEGLYHKTRIYATDMNEAVLDKARQGIFPLSTMQENTSNYLAAGGNGSFSEYYTAAYDNAIFRPSLRENMIFTQHNLVTDASFNEFNVIVCRNVLIYFNESLQTRVQALFRESLNMFGILALGKKETLRYSGVDQFYESIDEHEKIYRRIA